MILPLEYKEKMKKMLGEDYLSFIKSYEDERTYGLRVNTIKLSIDNFLNINDFVLSPIPWCKEGFYYLPGDNPGKHPYHESGMYYIQEPSAMAVVEFLNPQPNERILDLCAAPGGKSTAIAGKMKGEGILISNEINPKRARVLSENIERMGIENTIVTNEPPETISKKFRDFFHKVLVDAPCSGEGMFRKEPLSSEEWSLENVRTCAERQLNILEYAKDTVMKGGLLVYSTCTFSPEENEQVIEKFLKKNKEFSLEKQKDFYPFEHGQNKWTVSNFEEIDKAIRIWPHKVKGEGHFIAVMRKNGGSSAHFNKVKYPLDKNKLRDLYQFEENYLKRDLNGNIFPFGDNIYMLKENIDIKGLKVLRPGLHIGILKKNRFEPSHSLALYLKKDDFKNSISFSSHSDEIIRYLKGETLNFHGTKGWNLVLVDGYSIGWGKMSNGVLKNHYPRGLRWL